jgi:trigger factor
MAQLVPVEGRFDVQEGDLVVIDHEGTMDGAPFEGSKGEGVLVKLAPGEASPAMLAALAGKKIGDAVEFDETFPGDYRIEALRGKTARVKVTVKAIRARQVPQLDDALAKSLGVEGVDTLDQLRAKIRSGLERAEKERAETELRNALVKAALEKNEFEVPPSMIERAIDEMMEGAAQRFARSGIDIRTLGLDYGRLRADVREQALLQVRARLLLQAIADAEKLEVTDEDLQAEVAKIADGMGVPLAKVQQQMRGEQARAALQFKVREEKALALMTSAATITNA